MLHEVGHSYNVRGYSVMAAMETSQIFVCYTRTDPYKLNFVTVTVTTRIVIFTFLTESGSCGRVGSPAL